MYLLLTLGNLKERRLRTLLSLMAVSIAAGFLAVSFSAIIALSRVAEESERPAVLVSASDAPGGATLPFAYIAELRKLDGANVTDWFRFVLGGELGKHMFGILGHSLPDWPPSLFRVDAAALERWRNDRTGALVGKNTLAKMKWKLGDHVAMRSNVGVLEVNVDGVGEGLMDSLVLIHYAYLDARAPDHGQLTAIVLTTTREHFATLPERVDRLFADHTEPTLSMPYRTWTGLLASDTAFLPQLLAKITIVALFMMVSILGSTMMVSVRERRKEYATLRALGYSSRQVLRIVLFETVLVCLVGAVLGCLVPFCVSHLYELNLGGMLQHLVIGPAPSVLIIVATTCFGAIVGLGPGYWVIRQDVVSSLTE